MMPSIELELTGMAYGGEAFGRDAEGRMVFVPFTIPGERVRARIHEEHQRWARGYAEEILEASPLRIPARCLHFGVCGGCHYQHLSYEQQLRYKREIVIDQLKRIGGFDDPTIEEAVASPSHWNYRNHVRFHRTPDGSLGFHLQVGEGLFSVEECHLPEELLNGIWPEVDVEDIEAIDQVSLRSGSGEPAMIVLHASGNPEVEALFERPASVVWKSEAGTYFLAGDDHVEYEVNGRSFRVSPGSFFQINTQMTGKLVEHVVQLLDPDANEHLLDLYAGAGLFSRFLAEQGVELLAIEESPEACADFLVNLEGFESVELWAATVEEGLTGIELQPEAVLLDPPRAGLSNAAFDELVRIAPGRIVYVSCDPATLARDGKKLAAAGYEFHSLTPFDMFPQTYHIETVSLWLAGT